MDRREFLRNAALGGAGLSGLPYLDGPSEKGQAAQERTGGAGADRPNADRPNILVILADDMGFSDVGCYGSEIETPNVDRLAEEGVRFSQFYNAARCCPTRASLLTGLYPHQAGIGHMRADLGLPAYRGYLNDRCVTVGEALQDAGYTTCMSGKWHLGQAFEHQPNARGFDHFSGLLDGASDYFNPPPNRAMVRKNRPFAPKHKDLYEAKSSLLPDFYMTDFITDEAVDFVEQYAGGPDPLFLYLAYTAPHWPMQAPEPDIQKYEGRYREGWDPVRRARHERQLDSGLFAEDWTLAPRDERVPDWASVDDKARWDRKMATYAAMVDRMDRGIGRVLGALEAAGALDDTLVLFLSDNGAAASGIGKGDEAQPGTPESYTGYHRPWANVSDTPFRRYKIWTHEGGIATPLIARWPGEVPAGETRHLMGHVIDILPTCLDAAGASYPSTYDGRDITPTEGRSLLPAFRGEADRLHDALFWTHTDNHAVREGRWKLVTSDGRDTWSLYDMATDRTELEDRAEDRPDLVKRLARRHQTWSDRVGVLPWSEYRERRRAQS